MSYRHPVLLFVILALLATAPFSSAQSQQPSEEQRAKILKRFPKADTNKDGKLTKEEIQQFRQSKLGNARPAAAAKPTQSTDAVQDRGKASVGAPTVGTGEVAAKWKTTGFQQANSMGGGEAAISKSGKFRVFVLMGQSNMHGTARANELKPPYAEKHDRIRIWANGRWEYFVPTQRFGPGVSFAHQLAEFWPNDTIGIIKVSVGGTGIRGFEKNWSFERANLTFDGKKGSMYKDLMNAVTEAKRISEPEFCGFFWKQGGADGTKKVLANDYYDTFAQLVSDLRKDLDAADLPVFVPAYMSDEDLLKAVMSKLSEQDVQKVKNPAGRTLVKNDELLASAVKFLNEASVSKLKKMGGKRPYMITVIAAQNRVGRELPNVATIYPGDLPKGSDGTHFTAEGYVTLGKFTASAVEEFYKAKR